MGKYDDAIGGGKIILDVEEILNEESANRVDKKIKEQKAEIEKPVKINVEVDDSAALKKLDKLTQAVRKNRTALKGAIASGQSIRDISNYISTHKQLEKQIQAVTKEVKNNNKAIGSSKRALTDAKKLIDSLSISLEKIEDNTGVKPVENVDQTVKKAVTAVSKFQKVLGDLTKKYGQESFTNIFGGIVTSFSSIDESNALQVYDALIAKDKEYQKQLEKESNLRKQIAQEVQSFADATKFIYQNGEPSQDILQAYTTYWEKISSGAMSAADAVKAFEAEWNQLGGAVDYQQKKQIDEIRMLIKNQKDWLKYLDQSLNADNYKTSGKREATNQLRDLTNSMINRSRDNYANDPGEYAREMAEVAWVQGYREAERQGVAESTLRKYYSSSAMMSYDDNFKTLQEVYDDREKLLNEQQEELDRIAKITEATKVQTKAIEEQTQAVEKNIETKKKEIKKPTLLESVEILDDRIGYESDSKTVAQKRKVAEEMLRNQWQLYKDMQKELEDKDNATHIFGSTYDDLHNQGKVLESYIAIYEKYGGKVEKLGKKFAAFATDNGYVGSYQYALDEYNEQLSAIETETAAIKENTAAVKENAAAKAYSKQEDFIGTDNLQKENSLLEQKITNLKTINSLLAEEELDEEQIVDIINAYRSAMEVAQDSPMFQEADNFKNQIAQKFADEAEIQIDTVHGILKDVSLSGEQAIEYFEQLADGVPLEDIKKLETSADSTGDSYDNAAQDVSELTVELKNANQEADKLAEKSKLVAMHGLSIENLKDAISKGGFPAPSVALTDPDVYSGGYGEATVVFKKSAIDPAQNPANKIYGVDAYTATYPSFGYELNEDELIKASERTGIAIEELRLACDRAHKNIIDAVGTVGFRSNIASELQDLYIKEMGHVIETKQKRDKMQMHAHTYGDIVDEDGNVLIKDNIRDFISKNGITYDNLVNDDNTQKQYIDAIRKYISDYNNVNKELIEAFPRAALRDSIASDAEAVLKAARYDKALYDEEKAKFEHDQAVLRGELTVVDIADLNDQKSAFISENRQDYKRFVHDIIKDVMVKPNVRGYKGQRFEYDLDGISAAISSFGSKNALYDEDPFMRKNMDDHLFIIGAAKNYKNIAEAEADVDRLQKDATGTHTHLENGYIKGLAVAIAKANNIEDQVAFDKILEAVDGNSTAEAIAGALKNSGLIVDDSTIQKLAVSAQEAANVPTQYFEAKPQRTLSLDDIEFVSLPSDFATTPDMKEALSKLGINVVEHISGDMESRANALKEGMQKFGEVDFISKLTEDIKSAEVATESAAVAQEKLAEANKEVAVSADNAIVHIEEQAAKLEQPSIDMSLPKLTTAEYQSLFGDGALDQLLSDLNIKGQDAERVADIFTELAQITKAVVEDINNGSESDQHIVQFNDCMQNAVNALINFGSVVVGVDEDLKNFDSHMKGVQIRYNEGQKAEFGDQWGSVRKRFSNVLTTKAQGVPVDTLWQELLDIMPSLVDTDIINDSDQLKYIVNMLERAREAKKDNFKIRQSLSDSDTDAIAQYVEQIQSDMFNKLFTISEDILKTENQITDAVERTNEARREGLQLSDKSASNINKQAQAEVTAQELIDRNINSALAELRTAKDNTTTLFTLKGVFEGDDLVREARSFIDNIAEKANLSVGKFSVKNDIVQVQLYNDELKVTVDQTYRLKAATEETEAALELVGKSYSQNVKAFNSNNFDIEGMQARALAAVNKTRSSLHGLEYDLTALENTAKNITSQDDYTKFSNQLKAAQDNIQAMRNAVVSKSSLNQLANMQRDMKNANTELETMRRKLQRLGDIKGIKDAQKTIDSMAESVTKFNNAADANAQQTAYNEYSGLRSQFNAQLGLLSVISSVGSSGDLITDKTNLLEEFTRWESNIRNIGMLSDETAEKIRGMGNSLSQVQDNTGLQNWVDDFKKLQSTVTFETMGKQTKARMDEIKSSLNAQKQELNALYKELDFDMQLDDAAPNADAVRTSYQSAIDMIERCTRAIGDQSQEEIAAATAAANSAKEKINAYKAVQDVFVELNQEEEALTGDKAIKGYYQTLNSTIQQITNLDSKINSFKIKDGGSGTWLSLIASLEMQRDELVQKVRDTASQIGDAFNDSFITGTKVDLPFSSILNSLGDPSATNRIESFLSDVRTQGVLTEQSIDKLVANLQNAQNKAEEFATAFAEKFSEVSKSAQTLEGLRRSGAISGEHELYKGGLDRLGTFQQYTSMLPQDITNWDAGQTVNFQRLANEVINYVSALEKASSKEAQYFVGKKQYSDILNVQEYDIAAQNMEKMSQSTDDARQKLEAYAKSFRDGNVVITDFKTSADGISKINFSFFDDEIDQFRTFSAEMGQFTNKVYTFETSMRNLTSGTDAAKKTLGTLGEALSRIKNADGAEGFAQQIRDEIQKLETALAEVGSSKDAGSQTMLKNLAADAQNSIKEISKLEQQWIKTQAAIESGDLKNLGKIDDGDVYTQMFAKIKDAAEGAAISNVKFDNTTNTLTYTLTDASGAVKEMIANIDGLTGTVTTGVGKVGQLKTAWQELGSGIGGIGKEILRYGANMLQVMDIVRYLRQGFNAVKEIDAALTELKKVTDETETSYRNFLNTASQTAGKIGSTVSDFTEATANFARLGYTMEESANMAETAIVYKNVADGLDTVEESTESIISTMKAFGIEADGTMSIVDKFNAVGNSFAITSAGIGEAFQRSASALYESGNTIDESIALVTAANSVIQNPEQVGTALKTLSLRLRGAKTELEEAGLETDSMAESTSTLQAKLKALTHGKVDIMLDPDTFKSTTQILREMSEAYEDMTDIERAAALELMGGKRQANILASVIKNFDIVEDVIKTSENSAGSALAENEKYLNSIQGHLDQLSNSTQTMWMNFMNADVVKFLIDIATGAVNLTDKIGLLNVAIAAFVAKIAFGGKSFGQLFKIIDVDGIKQLSFSLKGAAVNAQGVGIASAAASVGVQLLNAALSMGISLLAGFVISGLIKGLDAMITTSAEAAEAFEEAMNKIADTSEKFRSLKSSADEVIPRFAELAQGVDKFGKNVSLTDDEYSEFLSLNNKIAEMFPELNVGMDSNGNAMLSLSYAADTLTDSLWAMVEAEREAANKEIAKTMPDVIEGIKSEEKALQREQTLLNDRVKAYEGAESEITRLYSDETKQRFKDMYGDDWLHYWNQEVDRNKDYIAQRLYEAFPDNSEFLAELRERFTGENGVVDWYGLLNSAEMQNALAGLETQVEDVSTRIQKKWQQLNPVVTAWVNTDFTYQNMDSDMQSVVQAMIGNIDFSKLGLDTEKEIQNYITNNILNKISELTPSVQQKFADLMKVETSEMPLQDYINKIHDLINQIAEDSSFEVEDLLTLTGYGDILSDYESTAQNILDILDDSIPKRYKEYAEGTTAHFNALNQYGEEIEALKEKIYSLSPDEVTKAFDLIKNYGIDTWDELAEAIENKTFDVVLNYDTEKEGQEKLLTAIEESLSATGLTSDSIDALKQRYQDLEGYDPARLFEETANGIHLNAKALRELESEYRKQNTEDLEDKLKGLVDQYNELTNEIDQTSDAAERASLYAQRDNVLNQINDTATLAAQYAGLTSAYQKWQDVQSGSNERDMYEGVITGKEEVDEEISRGWLDEGTRAYLELLSGEDLSTANYDKLLEVYKQLDKNINSAGYSVYDFFTQNEDGESTTEGIYNFLDTVKVAQKELGKEWVKIGENGQYIFDFGEGGDKAVAEALGISEELVQIILRAAQDAGFEVNLDSSYTELADFEDEVTAVNDRLKELGATDYTFNINSTNVEDLEEQIDEAETALKNLKNEDGTLKVGVSEEDYQKAQTLLASLIYQKQTLDDAVILRVNVETIENGDAKETISALLEYKAAYNDLEIKTSLGVDTTEAQTRLDNATKALGEIPSETLTTLKIDLSKTPEEINQDISGITQEQLVTIGVNDDAIVEFKNGDYSADGKVVWTNNIDAITAWAGEAGKADRTAEGTVNWNNGESSSIDTFFDDSPKITIDVDDTQVDTAKTNISTIPETEETSYNLTGTGSQDVDNLNTELETIPPEKTTTVSADIPEAEKTEVDNFTNDVNNIPPAKTVTLSVDIGEESDTDLTISTDDAVNVLENAGYTSENISQIISNASEGVELKIEVNPNLTGETEETPKIEEPAVEKFDKYEGTITTIDQLSRAVENYNTAVSNGSADAVVWGEALTSLMSSLNEGDGEGFASMAQMIVDGINLLSSGALSEEDAIAMTSVITNIVNILKSSTADGAASSEIGANLAAGISAGLNSADWDTSATNVAGVINTKLNTALQASPYNVTVIPDLDQESLDGIAGYTFTDKTVKVSESGASSVISAFDQIKNYTIPTKYVRVHYYKTGDTDNISPVNGTAHSSGTAHVDGTAFKGGTWGAQKTETALVGELGPEILVRDGKWTTIGENGAEFTGIRQGDIIFNHKQTEQLLKHGYVTGRGQAYVEGTALSSGNGPGRFTVSSSSLSSSSSNKKSNKSSKSSSKAKDEFEELFDWIEVRLEEINEDIDLRNAKLENTIGFSNQNAVIDDLIKLNHELYDNLIAGATEYYSYAKTLLEKVPEEYRKAAQDGTIAIEQFVGETDEKTLEAIKDYREWVQKGADATQQAEETLTEISSLAKQAIDNIAADYENKRSFKDNKIDQLDAYNALLETDVGFESAKIYQAMMKENEQIISTLNEQRNAMQAELNKRVEAGEIKKYSQDWYDAVNDIVALDTEIIELKTDIEDLQDSINELHWDKFDLLVTQIEAITEEAENLIDILSNSDLVDKDTAEWTDAGITSLGLYAQQMEAAEVQAKQYEEEIKYLNKNWKNLGYTEAEYIDKLEELKSGQYDAIKAYHDMKDAIVDLTSERVDAIKEGIEKEIEAYEELIEKKKEELSAEKDLYDFQKGVANQQKEIADIERKLAALSADNSASARAQRAKLQAELAEAQQELQDTYYDRSISDQQEALDKELEAFTEEKEKEIEGWEEYLEDTNQVVSDGLALVKDNTYAIYQTLQDMGKEYGLSITESITSPWKEGEYAIQSFSEKFGIAMSATVEELWEVENQFKEAMSSIEQSGASHVDTVNTNSQTTQAAVKKESTSVSNGGNSGGNSDKDTSTSGKSYPYGKASETTGNIKKGAKGNAVKAIQYALNELGYGNSGTSKVDGIFGSGTQSAVKAFQSAMGIKVDGIVGTNTRAKFKLKGYASGTTGVKKDQLALIDELGEELVMHAGNNGKLMFMSKGSTVVPHDLTENLMQLGELNPQDVLDRSRPVISAPHITNNNIEITMEFGEVVHIDTVTNDTIPNLTKAIEKQMDKYMKNLNNNIRKYTR